MTTTTINIQQSYLLPNSTPTHKKHNGNIKSTLKIASNSNNPMFNYKPLNNYKTLICNSSFSDKSSSMKEQKWVHEGVITESLPNGMFWVQCENGDVILGYVSGKMRRGSIRILPGDKVKIEVSRYDSTRGRIIYRTRS